MKVTIQEAAEKRGKTLYLLSCDLEIPLPTVYGWHQFNKMPRQDYLDSICRYLQCGIQELLKPDYYP